MSWLIVDSMPKVQIGRAIDDGLHTFISGTAWGVDIVAAEVVLQYKASDPTIHLVCAVPHPGFEKRMSEAWQQRYRAVLEGADIVRTISQTQSRGCYQTRNSADQEDIRLSGSQEDSCRCVLPCQYAGRSTGGQL